ncbi:MAG: hypothetical protein ACTSO2_20100 [Promethearchaeota archaeon]
MRITEKDIKRIEKELNDLIGYKKFRYNCRYGYKAIDIYDKKGRCQSVYRTGLRSSEVYQTYQDIIYGFNLSNDKGVVQ